MIVPGLAPVVLSIIVAGSILLMLVRPRDIPEAYWIGGGVSVLLVLRLITPQLAIRAAGESLDVCLFLAGMMLLSEVARERGVFDWVSFKAVRAAGGSCTRLFALVYIAGTLVTMFMSNDATAVVLTPAVLGAVRRTNVQPLPYVFVCAFIANAASFLLPISNPANLVVFQGAMPALPQWMFAFSLSSVLSIGVTFMVLRFLFREHLDEPLQQHAVPVSLNADGKLALAGIGLMVVVLLTASSFGKDLGLPSCLAALAVTAAICIRGRNSPLSLLSEISWSTLVLVAGLFIMVDAVESIGAMSYLKSWLEWAQHFGAPGELMTGFAVGIANNLVNNLPLGLIAGNTVHAVHASRSLASAVMIGVDLGPNLSITGSLATILWLIALRKEKLNVSFWDFLKVGVIAMPVALFASLSGAILMRLLVTGS